MATAHILIVEDDADNRKILAYHLRRLGGVSYAEAANGLEALNRLREQPADLILMDMNMPTMNGFEATRAIRALPGALARIPILALTAACSDEERSMCIEAGVSDIIAKPIVDAAGLRDLVVTYLGLRDAEQCAEL